MDADLPKMNRGGYLVHAVESGQDQGHGLGLSIVQRIAHRLGGDVDVQSVLGEGCEFSFTLPEWDGRVSGLGQAPHIHRPTCVKKEYGEGIWRPIYIDNPCAGGVDIGA